MKLGIYAYRDNKVGFMAPFVDQSDASAIRGFSYAINSGEGIMNYQPSDFDLYKVGDFDSEKGLVSGISPIVMVISGASASNT